MFLVPMPGSLPVPVNNLTGSYLGSYVIINRQVQQDLFYGSGNVITALLCSIHHSKANQ